MKKPLNRLSRNQKKYGENLYKIRTELNLSQDAIAEIAGCAQSYISTIENGIHPLTAKYAKLLIAAFKKKYKKKVDPSDFGVVG